MDFGIFTPLNARVPVALANYPYSGASVRDWVAQLPLADPHRSAALLLDHLGDANTVELRPGVRLGFLEAIASATAQVTDGLLAQLLEADVGGRRGDHAADLLIRLAQHLITGYVCLLGSVGHAGWDKGRTEVTITRRILHHLNYVLLAGRARYRPAPAGLWRLAHYCFALAEPATRRRWRARRDVAEGALAEYRQLLLTTFLAPETLHGGTREDVVEQLRRLADQLLIVPLRQHTADEQFSFVLKLDGDHGPRRVEADSGTGSPHRRLLVTSRVAHLLDRTLKHTGSASGLARADAVALRRAVEVRRRRDSRHRLETATRFVAGVNAVRQLKLCRDARISAGSVIDTGDKHEWRGSPFGRRRMNRPVDAIYIAGEPGKGPWFQEEPGAADEPPTYDAVLVDRSECGFRLSFDRRMAGKVPTGQLLALCDEQGGRELLAVVRWVVDTGAGTELGAEIIGNGRLQPGDILVEGPEGFSDPIAMLAGTLDESAVLFLPPFPDIARRRTFVKTGNEQLPVSLGEPVLTTRAVQVFRFEGAESLQRSLSAIAVPTPQAIAAV